MAGWRAHVGTFLPIAALAVVPIAGIVYVAFAAPNSARPAPPDPMHAATNVTEPIPKSEIPASLNATHADTTPRPTALIRSAAMPVDAGGREAARHLCCEKLTDLAQRADVSVRATYQAGSAACNAASDLASAQTQVASIIEGSGALVPTECQRKI